MMQTEGKILAVDDDPNNIAILEELLNDNYELRISSNGEQALKIAQEFLPDMILLDIMMPGMNGYEVCRRLRKHNTFKETKIIILSAKAMNSEQIEGYHAGADDYLTKPFEVDELLEKVQVHLEPKNVEELTQINNEIS